MVPVTHTACGRRFLAHSLEKKGCRRDPALVGANDRKRDPGVIRHNELSDPSTPVLVLFCAPWFGQQYKIWTVAGEGVGGVTLYNPTAVAVDASGSLYIGDWNGSIRQIHFAGGAVTQLPELALRAIAVMEARRFTAVAFLTQNISECNSALTTPHLPAGLKGHSALVRGSSARILFAEAHNSTSKFSFALLVNDAILLLAKTAILPTSGFCQA